MPEGHLTVFYTLDAPYADEETGLKVYIGSAYKFLVLQDFPDDESVVESVPVCDCGDTIQTTSTPSDITSSSSTNIVALPSANAYPPCFPTLAERCAHVSVAQP